MRVGIDLGTTRTVIASVDRGNYPVLSVEDATGDLHEHIPTVVGLDGDDLLCGWEALAADGGRGEIARSFKRLLSLPDATGATPVRIGARERSLAEVMNVFAAHVIAQIRRSARCAADEPIEVCWASPRMRTPRSGCSRWTPSRVPAPPYSVWSTSPAPAPSSSRIVIRVL